MEWTVALIVGLVVGGCACWLVQNFRARAPLSELAAEHRETVAGPEGLIPDANVSPSTHWHVTTSNDMTNCRYIRGLSLVTVLFWLFSPGQPEGGEVGTTSPAYQEVTRQEILEAMRNVGDYDPTTTTNGARFQWEALLYLARRAEQRDPMGPPLFINCADWFRAFMEVAGRTESEMPLYARLSREYEQHMDVEYRMDRVIRKVIDGPAPQFALNVRIWWEDRPGKPDRYSYLDTLSTPNLKVTNGREMAYRLLDLGDWFACDKITGLTGRPTSGLLGLIFQIIGDGRLTHSRMAISNDGLQIVRGTSKKGFMRKTTTATIYPDGEMIKAASVNPTCWN